MMIKFMYDMKPRKMSSPLIEKVLKNLLTARHKGKGT